MNNFDSQKHMQIDAKVPTETITGNNSALAFVYSPFILSAPPKRHDLFRKVPFLLPNSHQLQPHLPFRSILVSSIARSCPHKTARIPHAVPQFPRQKKKKGGPKYVNRIDRQLFCSFHWGRIVAFRIPRCQRVGSNSLAVDLRPCQCLVLCAWACPLIAHAPWPRQYHTPPLTPANLGKIITSLILGHAQTCQIDSHALLSP